MTAISLRAIQVCPKRDRRPGRSRSPGVVRVGAEGRNDTVQPNVRRLAAHLLEHQSPQVGLPRQIGGQLSVKAVALPPVRQSAIMPGRWRA